MPANTGGSFLPLKRSEKYRSVKSESESEKKTVCGRKMPANTGGSLFPLKRLEKYRKVKSESEE